MAKNLLHTYTRYSNAYIDESFIGRLRADLNASSIGKLKAKEEQLYAKYGANNFEEFKAKLKSVFNLNDQAVIGRFRPDYLQKRLSGLTQQADLYEEKVEFVFDFSKVKSLGFTLYDGQKEQRIPITYNYSEVKKVLNSIFKKHHFKATSESMERADALIHQLLTSGALKIYLGNEGSDQSIQEEYLVHTIPNFPWGVTKELYDDAVKINNTAILDEIDRAAQQVRHFVFEELGQGASPDMRRAIENIWARTFGSGVNPAHFFSGGKTKSFISGVQGAMGEFQTALLFEYLSIKLGTAALPEIKGNIRLEQSLTKEKSRTDVEIFQAFGLQVKNFAIIEEKAESGTYKHFMHKAGTRIHPDKVGQYFGNEEADFLGFISNYFFNSTYATQHRDDMARLRETLGHWLGEIMNMAVEDSVEDTVTFYMIAGRYLVPCSVILEAADKVGLRQSVQITGPASRSDSDFNKSTDPRPYEEYWIYLGDGDWKVTDKNKTEFSKLISHSISIKTSFDFFDEIEKYSLY